MRRRNITPDVPEHLAVFNCRRYKCLGDVDHYRAWIGWSDELRETVGDGTAAFEFAYDSNVLGPCPFE